MVQASKRIAMGIVDGAMSSEHDAREISAAKGVSVMNSADAKEGPRVFAEKRLRVCRAE